MVRSIGKLLIVLMASLLTFDLIFGNVGQSFIWRGLEPVFQSHWTQVTFGDGYRVKETLDSLFASLNEIYE